MVIKDHIYFDKYILILMFNNDIYMTCCSYFIYHNIFMLMNLVIYSSNFIFNHLYTLEEFFFVLFVKYAQQLSCKRTSLKN